MANLGKKWTCFNSTCSAKFYDFTKPEAICPKCGANQKDAPAKPKVPKKEKAALLIDDDFIPESDVDLPGEDSMEESLGISGARAEGVEAGERGFDDEDE